MSYPKLVAILNKFQLEYAPINEKEIEKMFKKIEEAKENVDLASDENEKKERIFELSKSYRQSIQAERQIAGIAKAPYVVEYVRDLMELEEKIVVYVHHLAVHEILKQGLYNFAPLQIVGGQTDKQRFEQIDLFQKDESRKLIICALRAGNVGINLTAGNYVIFGELDWSPPVHRQAEDRLHRIGQKNPVFAHYLIGDNTMDEHVQNILTDKTLEIDAVMGDKKELFDQDKARIVLEKMHQRIKTKSKLAEFIENE